MLRVLKIIWETIRTILSIVLVFLLAIIITQRVTNNKMAVLGLRVFNVATESMVPEYLVGDAILVKQTDPKDIKIGDDVTYLGAEESFKDRIVTHRVIDKANGENGLLIFETKGIANEKADPKINETQIYGKVIYKVKFITYLNGIIGNLYGMYFAIIVPFALISFIEYVISQKEEKDDDSENNENNENEEENKSNRKKARKQRLKERRRRRREKRKNRLKRKEQNE